MSEHTEQSAVFEWAALMSNRYPELQLLFAIPNAGKRSYGAAAWMKQEGLKSGVPDMFLAVTQQNWYDYETADFTGGLFIEMKRGKNKTTPEQDWWIQKLKDEDYQVSVCYSADEAIAVIKDYLGISDD